MKTIGNILWVLLGGWILALGWAIAGLLCFITIVGIPLGFQCFKFAGFVFWPFGKRIEYSSSGVAFIINIIWILLVGWELALAALIVGAFYCITIIGIPFGIQSFKFAQLALMPFGAQVLKD